MPSTMRRGPDLPYLLVAGVTPWSGGWLLAGAKHHAATFMPELPRVFETFFEVLGERPGYATIVVNAPIGYRDEVEDPPRTCDLVARSLLGRRGSTIARAPTRASLREDGHVTDGLDATTLVRLRHYRELYTEMSPFRQRVVYEGHPELSFYQLNGDEPLRYSKLREEGREERRSLLEKRIQNVHMVLDAEIGVPEKHLYDAVALMWTARRVNGKAAKRIPNDAEWDSEGLRTEYVY
ncbi:MAG: DUF429 domain-containing protein [Acidimicrobiales bacterium]